MQLNRLQPCANVQVRGIYRTDEEHNPKTTKVLTDAIVSVLSGEGSRVFVIVEDVPNTNWSADGKLLTWIDN
jgi:phenylpyruvate tautomerase PptA (4-oxalocrotonate tautomerase family)